MKITALDFFLNVHLYTFVLGLYHSFLYTLAIYSKALSYSKLASKEFLISNSALPSSNFRHNQLKLVNLYNLILVLVWTWLVLYILEHIFSNDSIKSVQDRTIFSEKIISYIGSLTMNKMLFVIIIIMFVCHRILLLLHGEILGFKSLSITISFVFNASESFFSCYNRHSIFSLVQTYTLIKTNFVSMSIVVII